MTTEVLDRDTYETKDGKIYMTDNGDLREMAAKIISQYPGHFKYCYLDDIEFALVEGMKADWLGKAIKLSPLQRLFMKGRKFVILMNTTMIEHTAPLKTALVMHHELFHCDCENDRIRDHDTKNFALFLKTFGFDWHSNKETILPEDELRRLASWAMTGKTASGKEKFSAAASG